MVAETAVEPISGGFPRIGTSNSEAILLNLKNKAE